MFKKVLLSEDMDTISQGIMTVMEALHIDHVQQSQYCDEAYLKIKKASVSGVPFDLLISDLSFIPDHREQELKSGEALIKKLKWDFPELKIIVYTIENRKEKVRSFMKDIKVDAFVSKGRRGLRELEMAIVTVDRGESFVSPELGQSLRSKSSVEIIDSDIELLQMLSNGHSQDQISFFLKEKNIKPSSLSALEKRLNVLRNHFGAHNVVHLIAITKDLGLI